MVEVNLGDGQSLKEGLVHVNQRSEAKFGENIVDDSTVNSSFKLVMVGRKLSHEE